MRCSVWRSVQPVLIALAQFLLSNPSCLWQWFALLAFSAILLRHDMRWDNKNRYNYYVRFLYEFIRFLHEYLCKNWKDWYTAKIYIFILVPNWGKLLRRTLYRFEEPQWTIVPYPKIPRLRDSWSEPRDRRGKTLAAWVYG